MKKLVFMFVAIAGLSFASCGGNKGNETVTTDDIDTVEVVDTIQKDSVVSDTIQTTDTVNVDEVPVVK